MALVSAAVCHQFGADLIIEAVDLAAPGPGEVEVSMAAVAICHSDISYADGDWGGPLPAVFGHEGAGTVSALGPGVTGLKPGDRVLVTLIRACGGCLPCATGHPTRCEKPYDGSKGPLRTAAGGPLVQGLATAAFAQKVVVDKSQVVLLPADMPLDAACLLACGVITGIGAVVHAAGLRAGQDVVVIGAGGVGLNAIQGARIAGARRIVAVDLTPQKLDIAREFGATDTVLASRKEPWGPAKVALGRGADAVFVTVGSVEAMQQAPFYLARGGKVVLVGMPPSGAMASFEAVRLGALSQSLIATRMGDVVLARDIPWLVDLYRQGRLKLDELISGRWRLDQINAAIADTRSGNARRNVITFDP